MERAALARRLMATRFEILLEGSDPITLRAAGEEALEEIAGAEAQLSLFLPASEISRVNRLAAEQPVPVSPPVFDLLARCRRLWELTEGAFDITVGPLLRCWSFFREPIRRPSEEELTAARKSVGMQHVLLDPAERTARFLRPGMLLDLGGVGKGWAIDLAVEALKAAGVSCAFLHGGTSAMHGFGQPAAGAWKVSVPHPETERASRLGEEAGANAAPSQPLAIVELRDVALSVSSIWGRGARLDREFWGHVLDPRSGRPVRAAALAAARAPSAADADALSTALLVLGPAGIDRLRRAFPEADFMAAAPEDEGWRFAACGIPLINEGR